MNEWMNKIRDLFKVKLYAIRSETKKEREREKKREREREKRERAWQNVDQGQIYLCQDSGPL